MKGISRLDVTHETLIAAVQLWADQTFKEKVVIKSVEQTHDGTSSYGQPEKRFKLEIGEVSA